MFQTEKSIKIKIEVDTCPPLNFKTEQKLLLQPHSFIHLLVSLYPTYLPWQDARSGISWYWKNRVKGRDWYDFEWYTLYVPLDFTIWQNAFNNEEITPELFKEKLIERLSTDIKQVADVLAVRAQSERVGYLVE